MPVHSFGGGVRWEARTVNESQAESGAEAPRQTLQKPTPKLRDWCELQTKLLSLFREHADL